MIVVAFVVYRFGTGGLERCIAELVNELDHTRFKPLVICLDQNGNAARWVQRSDVPIIELRKRQGNDVRVIQRLAQTLADHRVDIVVSHNWGTLLESTGACLLRGNVCHIHAEHGQELDAMRARGLKQRVRAWAMRCAFERIDRVVACAESVRTRIHSQCNFPRRRIVVIPNGVNLPSVMDPVRSRNLIRQELGIPEQSVVLGSVGRLVPVKDFGTLIHAVSLLKKERHHVNLILVGDGSERDRLILAADDFGVSNRVHFVGRQENVGDWLSSFDVYVNSSLGEAMSLSILEAMAVGLPIVATAVGDNNTLVSGDPPCGLVVPAGAAEKLAKAISQLVRNQELRQTMGRRARQRHTDSFSLIQMIKRYESLVLDAVCKMNPLLAS